MRRILSIGIPFIIFAVIAAAWELLANYGGFPPKLVPGLGVIAETLVRLAGNGVLAAAAVATLYRLVAGFVLAALIGVAVGIAMGRRQWVEDTLLPIVAFLYPIPGLAYAPLFVLWFGLGDFPTILLVGISSCFTVIINTWKGVKAVKPIWLRSAEVMGARDRDMFRRVVLPGALPYILVGLRLGLAQSWRILIAVEMLMSVQRGLGWLIFGAQTFLNTDVMLASIATIGIIGIVLEREIFARIERLTVVRWGMRHGFSWIAFARGIAGIVVLLAVWEAFARSGMFSTAMTPPVESVAKVLWRTIADGSLIENAAATLVRVFIGLSIAFAIAVPVGALMARYWVAERIFLPVLSVLLPIPSLAWVPLFVLWFGIGNFATILVVIYAATFPMVYSVWSGVRAVNPIWLRAAIVMGADEATLFRKVIWPGSLPYIITGLRLSFGRAWIGVIGGELLASPQLGLGEIIFNAKEFLDAGVMLSTLVGIGAIGVFFERFVFQRLEAMTVRRWGMVSGSSA
jgi:NitT/TauT family transport system permease protein